MYVVTDTQKIVVVSIELVAKTNSMIASIGQTLHLNEASENLSSRERVLRAFNAQTLLILLKSLTRCAILGAIFFLTEVSKFCDPQQTRQIIPTAWTSFMTAMARVPTRVMDTITQPTITARRKFKRKEDFLHHPLPRAMSLR